MIKLNISKFKIKRVLLVLLTTLIVANIQHLLRTGHFRWDSVYSFILNFVGFGFLLMFLFTISFHAANQFNHFLFKYDENDSYFFLKDPEANYDLDYDIALSLYCFALITIAVFILLAYFWPRSDINGYDY